jgi:hypothetical protein
MGPAPIKNVPCAKGALCYCLDEFSKGSGARSRIAKLRDAIAALAPSYAGLTDVFDRYLVSHVISDAEQRQRIAANLNAFWLDPGSRKPFFPAEPVAEILAKGILETLDLSLKGKGRAVPINAWWVLDSAELRTLNMADVKGGVTIGGRRGAVGLRLPSSATWRKPMSPSSRAAWSQRGASGTCRSLETRTPLCRGFCRLPFT